MSFNFPRILLTVVSLASVVLAGMWVYVVFFQR
jgi:hypothetical protein